MSKRKLRRLVEEGYVSGWDDPRMPTLRGMRRRGYTAEAIVEFVQRMGISTVATSNAGVIADVAFLEEYCGMTSTSIPRAAWQSSSRSRW